MKKLLFLILLGGFISCINFKSKNVHKYTIELCNLMPKTCNCNLYVEGYTVLRAFGTTDIDSEYLTDSNSFKIYAGNYDEGNERVKYICHGDTVFFEKQTNKDFGQNWDTFRILEKKVFIPKDLKKLNKFE
jgi:hypothetical protein